MTTSASRVRRTPVGRRWTPQGSDYRPAFGFVPWLAFDLRAFILRFDVFFDIESRGYRPVQARSSSADHVLTMRSGVTPHSAARSQP